MLFKVSIIDERDTIMSKEILKRLNRSIRTRRPKLSTDKVCQVFKTKELLEIGFLSKCCRNDLSGSCIMCDYGCAIGTQENSKYIDEMKRILDEESDTIECLLLCTNGSFFDEFQIPLSLFKDIITIASEYSIPTIEFETHYLDVTSEKLNIIQEMLPNKHIMIEMGLESTNPLYQENIIMKNIDLSSYEQKIQLIHQYGFEAETNILVGLPFLNSNEQLKDAYDTVMWAFAHQCKVVLFPINIKPYTVLMQMYKNGVYSPVSHWLLILLLNSIPVNELGKVTIAWYGNREERYSDSDQLTIFPVSCHQCNETIMSFYSDFLDEQSGEKRKKLVEQLMSECKCTCLADQISMLNQPHIKSFETMYSNYCNILNGEYTNKTC